MKPEFIQAFFINKICITNKFNLIDNKISILLKKQSNIVLIIRNKVIMNYLNYFLFFFDSFNHLFEMK